MKLYDMDQHNYDIHQSFKITRSTRYSNKPYWISYGVLGFGQVLKALSSSEHSLTMDELFRIFIDNKARQHVILYLDDKGDIISSVKIEEDTQD